MHLSTTKMILAAVVSFFHIHFANAAVPTAKCEAGTYSQATQNDGYGTCPSGWVRDRQYFAGCFKFRNNNETWSSAAALCESSGTGAYLFSPWDSNSNTAGRQYCTQWRSGGVGSGDSTGDGGTVWIGVFRKVWSRHAAIGATRMHNRPLHAQRKRIKTLQVEKVRKQTRSVF